MMRTAGTALSVVSFLLLFLLAAPGKSDSFAADKKTNRVFILNSYHQGYTFSDNEMRGIDEAFARSGVSIEKYISYMDAKRIPATPQYFRQLKELIAFGYKGIRFDVLITTDNDALEFMRKYRDELFPGVPVVFSGINNFDVRMLDGRKDLTGTVEETDYAGTINIALKLLPATNNIVIVTDNTTTGKAHSSAVDKIRRDFPASLDFTYLSLGDMTHDELASKLSQLTSGSIVLLLHHTTDRNRVNYPTEESTALLSGSSAVPVFIVNDYRLGFGPIGGELVSGYSQGEAAAGMVLKILGGTDVSAIPVLKESPNRYMFDYTAMRRFSISETNLPRDGIVINKPVSVRERYAKEILMAGAVFIILSGVLVFLLMEMRRRRKIELSLRESEQKHRLLFDSAGDAIFIHDLEGRFLAVNQLACERYDYSHADFMSLSVGELDTPEESSHIAGRFEMLKKHSLHTFETLHRRRDGALVPAEVNARLISWEGDQAVMSICRDITERRKAEEALRESERRIQKKLNSLLSSGSDIGELALEDIIDTNSIQTMMDDFYKFTRVPVSIIDLEGKVLVGTGW